MKKQNYLVPIITIIGVIILTSLFTGFPFKIPLFYSAPQLCSVTPHASNCICPEGEERISATITTGTFYNCESITKIINPDASDFDAFVTNMAQTKLAELYPECNMASCNLGTAKWDLFRGTAIPSNDLIYRTAGGYCEDDFGRIYADIRFNIVSGDVISSHCGNYVDPTDPNSVVLNFKGYFFGHGATTDTSPNAEPYEVISSNLLRTYFERYPDCNIEGAVSTEVELILPEGINIDRIIENSNIQQISVEGNKVKFRYTLNCPNDNSINEVPVDIQIFPNQACDLSPNHLILIGQDYCSDPIISCNSSVCRNTYQIFNCASGATPVLKETREILSCDDSTQPISYEEIPATCIFDNQQYLVGQKACVLLGCLAGGNPDYCYYDVYTCSAHNTWEYSDYGRKCDDSTQPISYIPV